MQKKASCTSVQNNGTINTKFGMKYSYEVGFDNGDVGNCLADGECRFKIGQMHDYTITQNGKYTNIKFVEVKDNNWQSGNSNTTAQGTNTAKPSYSSGKSPEESNRIARMNALTNAINYSIEASKTTPMQLLDVLTIAQEFEKFICNGMNGTQVAIEYNKTNAGISRETFEKKQMNQETDDLPF